MFVARSSTVAARLLEDEMVIMCPRTSKLFVLNPVGTVIWEALDGRTPLSEIVRDHVYTQFEVTPDVALTDASEFVRQLAEHGVVVIGEEPLSSEVPERELRKAV
jgi:hypothetical protein